MALIMRYPSTGKLIRKNGKLCTSCCGVNCSVCGDLPTPYALRVTFAGITPCSQLCLGYAKMEWLDDFNQSFKVIQSPTTPCYWAVNGYHSNTEGYEIGRVRLTNYSGPNCTGTPTEVIRYVPLRVLLLGSPGSKYLYVIAGLNTYTDPYIFLNTAIGSPYFNQESEQCISVTSAPNTIPESYCSSWSHVFGWGGTVSVSSWD